MYPYSSSQQNHLLSKNAMNKKVSINKTDKRLEKLLNLSQKETTDFIKKYYGLMCLPELAKSKQLLQTMYLDELKHLKLLQEALYLTTKNSIVPNIDLSDSQNINAKELIEDMLLLEMDNASFYKNLSLAMVSEDLKQIFYDIASTKQTHASALSYLFSKYFV